MMNNITGRVLDHWIGVIWVLGCIWFMLNIMLEPKWLKIRLFFPPKSFATMVILRSCLFLVTLS